MAWGDGSDGIAQVVTVENSSISNNNAKDGAGIFINLQDTATNAFVTINLGVGAIVQENKATRNGGGIFARNLGNTAVLKGRSMLLKAAQCTITPQRPQATTCISTTARSLRSRMQRP